MHKIQLGIIKKLKNKASARFSELNDENLSSDIFNFHLKKLVNDGFINKDNQGYHLLPKGKLFSLEIDNTGNQILNQRISVILLCRINESYMIQERLIHPYKNYFEFPSRKVEFGSNPEDTVKLIANEELGIGISKIKFHGVNHKLDLKAEKDKVLSDRYFLIYSCESNTENFKPVFEDGYNHLMDLKAFKQKKLRHFDDTNILKIYKSESFLMDVSGFPIDF